MKRAKHLPTSRAPVLAPDAVRELCESIEGATRNMFRAGPEIRHAIVRGLELFADGAIDHRGLSSIYRAAAKVNKSMRTVALGAHAVVAAEKVVDAADKLIDKQRRIDQMTSITLSPGQFKKLEDRDT